jgi:hypothetical protein
MPKQVGLVKVQGTLDGVIFDKNGNVRRSPLSRPITAERTKENNEEFKNASKAGKVVRDALRKLDTADRYQTSRMFALMRSLISKDTQNLRGERVVFGEHLAPALVGFELNDNSIFASVAPISLTVNSPAIGEASIVMETYQGGALASLNDVYAPEGTTHIEAVAMSARLSIGEMKKELIVSVIKTGKKGYNEAMTWEAGSLNMSVMSGEVYMVAISLNFYQEVNGGYYKLSNGSYDTGKILLAQYQV